MGRAGVKGESVYTVTVAATAVRLQREWKAGEDNARPARSGGGSRAGLPGLSTAGRKVRAWSARSRNGLRWALSAMPWEELGERPAMVTLTYPAEWRKWGPDGPTVARQFRAFQKRWARRWGEPLRGVWVREFQQRGAPHYHMYVGLPEAVSADEYDALVRRTVRRRHLERSMGKYQARRKAGLLEGEFGLWLLGAWSGCVGAGGAHERFGADVAPMFWGGTVQEAAAGRVDWAKVSRYLWQESGKWGQKTPPDGYADPGRSWGMLVVKPSATEGEVEAAVAMEVRRVLWRVYRRQSYTVAAARGQKVRKPYRGVDGMTLYGLKSADTRRLLVWAEEEVEWKRRRIAAALGGQA